MRGAKESTPPDSRASHHGKVMTPCRNGTGKACNSLLQGSPPLCPAYVLEAVAASTAAS